MADERGELRGYALRWHGRGHLVAAWGRTILAELRRWPGGHTRVSFAPGLAERQRHRLYDRLLEECAAGGDEPGEPERRLW
jgi:hypothetical protein